MKLLLLAPERLSLEFEPGEFAVVQSRLRWAARKMNAPARIVRRPHHSYESFWVNEHEFILMADFGESCLISTSLAGDALLQAAMRPTRRTPARLQRRSFRDRRLASIVAA